LPTFDEWFADSPLRLDPAASPPDLAPPADPDLPPRLTLEQRINQARERGGRFS
jgi:hypothetical protein